MSYKEIPDISKQLRKNIKRLPIILCEDVSGSMEVKRDLMNQQLENFFSIQSLEPEVCKRTDIEVVKFSTEVYKPISATLDEYVFDELPLSEFGGTTHLWSALEKALELSSKYFNCPNYWAPWIILYTDGFPNDESDEVKNNVIEKLQKYEEENKVILFILGIGDKNDEEQLNCEILNSISKRGSKVIFYAYDQEIDIYRFFQFMIRTITKTLTNTSFFINNKDGTYYMDNNFIEQIYDLYEKQKSLK